MYIICLQISACSRITDLTGYINIWEHALCQSRMVGKKCGLAETEKNMFCFKHISSKLLCTHCWNKMHCETKMPMADACPHPSHGSPEDISAASGRRDMGFFSSQDVAEMACHSPFKMWPKWHVTATKSRTVKYLQT